MRNKNCQRGNIAVFVALVGLGIVTLGIFAGKTLVDIGTRLLPQAQAPATNSSTFLPEADSYVDKSSPNQNYGKSTTIRVNGSSSVMREGYLRFNVSGIEGPVTKAELYLTSDDDDTDDGPAVYLADNTWNEAGITYNNRPAKAAEKIADLKNIEEDQTVIVDITSVIAGNGMYTLALIPTSSDGIRFLSREASANRPSLKISYVIPTPTPTPTLVPPVTATSTPTPTPSVTPTKSPAQLSCENSGHTWKIFGDGCVDNCAKAADPTSIACTMAATWGCDCGEDKCWDFDSISCQLNPSSSLTPTPTCVPRPECLDYPIPCQLVMPPGGFNFCPNITPTLTPFQPSITGIPSCVDSDGGVNIYEKGTVEGLNPNGTSGSYTDFCISSSVCLLSDPNCATQYYTNEGFCQGGSDGKSYIASKLQPCDQGCTDGACIPSASITAVPLTITPTPTGILLIPGDANEDGKVDGIDYVIWLKNYNQQTGNKHKDGDFNGDGKVDGMDYVIWLKNYNFTSKPTPTPTPDCIVKPEFCIQSAQSGNQFHCQLPPGKRWCPAPTRNPSPTMSCRPPPPCLYGEIKADGSVVYCTPEVNTVYCQPTPNPTCAPLPNTCIKWENGVAKLICRSFLTQTGSYLPWCPLPTCRPRPACLDDPQHKCLLPETPDMCPATAVRVTPTGSGF